MVTALSYQALSALYFLSFPIQYLEDGPVPYTRDTELREANQLLQFVREAAQRPLLVQTSAPIRITRALRVFVGPEELRVRPMAKAILLLFLRHPEGIVLKEIGDYRAELTALYRRLCKSDVPGEAEGRVGRILDLFSNELNVNISRVNAAMNALAAKGQEPLYRVEGAAGTPKSIRLDRAQVLWE